MQETEDTRPMNVLDLHREKYERRLQLRRWLRGLSVRDMLMLANMPKGAKPLLKPKASERQ
jgi:hypothetical protein